MPVARQVTDQGQAVGNLNELEAVDDEIWANIWLTDCIARINPQTGAVKCAPARETFSNGPFFQKGNCSRLCLYAGMQCVCLALG